MTELEIFVLLGFGVVIIFYGFIFLFRYLWGSNWKTEKDNF